MSTSPPLVIKWHYSKSSIRVVSFKEDSTYTIHSMKGMNAADSYAETFTDQTHYLNHDNRPWVTKWAGPSRDHPRWIETNEPQSKTALFLLTLENYHEQSKET